MKKIVYIDYDGTLRNDNGEINQRTKNAINEFTKAGNHIVLCTGQPRYNAQKISKEIGCPSFFISSNGAEIYNNEDKKIIKIVTIEDEDFIKIYEYAKKNDIRIMAVSDDKEFVTKKIVNENQYMIPESKEELEELLKNNKIKQIVLNSEDSEKISRAREEVTKNISSIAILNQSDSKNKPWFAIGNSKVSKGQAIKDLSEHLGVPIENTIGIGNGYNDISMFSVVGKSVAMENAIGDIKDRVDFVTASNNCDGVAVFLESIL